MYRIFAIQLVLVVFTHHIYANSQGRLLFVDDSDIATTTLTRKYHYPRYNSTNPVLKADKYWEYSDMSEPYAAPFSGGVWYDETQSLFKMFYSAGGGRKDGLITCYAESLDGRHWNKPNLDVVPGTNIVDTLEHDCVSVLLDKFEPDSLKRYKMFAVIFNSPNSVRLVLKYSADGIHWSDIIASSGEIHDRTGVYYDPFRGKYVLSLKTINGIYRRARNFLSNEDIDLAVSLAHRTFDTFSDRYIKFWFNADDDDPRHELFPSLRPQIYNHEAIPYESMLLGYFTIWQGPENKECRELGIQKKNEVLVGWSRDGFNWNRQNKVPFLPVGSNGSWNEGNIQSTAGSPIIVGDSLYFYFSGRCNNQNWRSNFSTGLATLRRDGFVSLSADDKEGYIITKDIEVDNRYLFINADIASELLLEVLDNSYTVLTHKIKGFNSTKMFCLDLSDYEGRYIQLKISFLKGDLYSFWLSKYTTGESGGYTSGGGPGLSHIGRDEKTN